MRGEHYDRDLTDALEEGSSPHARGAPSYLQDALGQIGIIPACAGSTADITEACDDDWDHPRMRGEHRQ